MSAHLSAAQQGALFGDPVPVPAQRTGRPTSGSQDLDLVASVVKAAQDPGYLIVERSGRIFRADPARPGVVDAVPAYEAEAVNQLIDAKHLTVGGTHHVHHDGTEGPARSVLVPKTTRDMVTRWSNLRPIATPARRAAPTPTPASTKTRKQGGRAGDKPVSGPIVVDVVRPGRGLLTRYVVETEFGHVVGRASSYRLGAELLARHHGYTPGPIEIDRREERDGNTPPTPTARDRQLGR